jgi:hypothetical protein
MKEVQLVVDSATPSQYAIGANVTAALAAAESIEAPVAG